MKKAFKAINKEFSDYFKLMFGGGTAKLERTKFEKRRITSSEDDLENEDKKEFEYGLEIKVNPPGKRIDSLNMLSGGERTLTSIALLFALISHNPPPFVFLDEIEANLDESNAGKFSRILKKLSSKTQFVLATHSREVMRVADILYGITMNKKDGYSKIFSVKLGQVGKGGEIK
jgi:chromosome segregation protein